MTEQWRIATEPLAYKVLPQPGEFFDSWLDRVTARHDTTRIDLFKFLDLDPEFARLDIGIDSVFDRNALDIVLEKLSWAVQCDVKLLRKTRIPIAETAALPPFQRTYACPECCLEASNAGRPVFIRREWVLRASWNCPIHQTLLLDIRSAQLSGVILYDSNRLKQLASIGSSAFDQLPLSDKMLLLNKRAVQYIIGDTKNFSYQINSTGYAEKVNDSLVHIMPQRTLLLARMHCHDRGSLAQYESMFRPLMPPDPDVWSNPFINIPEPSGELLRHIKNVLWRRIRKQSAALHDLTEKLKKYDYLGHEGWYRAAKHNLALACASRRDQNSALDNLKLARDYATRAKRNLWPHAEGDGAGKRERFDPAFWGFNLPSFRALTRAVDEAEKGKRKSDEAPDE